MPARWLVLAAPYLWLVLLFLVPFLLVAKVSLSHSVLSQPPYAPTFDIESFGALWAKLRELSLSAYVGLTDDTLYTEAYFDSVMLAAIATLVSLCIAYPFALAIARAPRRRRPLLVLLAVAPFWTSFLIRVYAWIMILKDEGLINNLLLSLGLIHEPLHIFATDTAVVIGIVYSYLPFMILPLYAALEKQDQSLVEAANDLGASAFAAFWRITFPLSLPGVLAACLIVFIPAVGEFVIPDLLGGSDTLMIGGTLWNEFFNNRDWPTACAVAIVLLVLLVGPLVVYERAQSRVLP